MKKTKPPKFEWDENKRRSTLKKHGIDFEDAARILVKQAVVRTRSDRLSEKRWIATGAIDERIISVVYTFRRNVIRIITARRARKNEKREYYKIHPERPDRSIERRKN